jgi:hypothetical protein
MAPRETVPVERAGWFRQSYGVRTEDGRINGAINWGTFGRDITRIMMMVLQAIMVAAILGGWGIFKWYIKNQDSPDKFDRHCTEQISTDKKIAEDISEIKEGIRELQRRRRDDRP